MATTNTSGSINRITKEIANIQQNTDLSLSVACKDSDVRNVRALIVGPPETPYEYGFFEFELKFGRDYSIKSPHVRSITTNSGRTRFNPNIYNEGKVCLSILGTWRGNPGEEWSSAQGLESVLLSIQSLMSSNPYENEPGYETAKKEEKMPQAYVEKIRHETVRIAVVQRLEGLLGISSKREADYLHLPKRPRLEGSFSPAGSTSVASNVTEASESKSPSTHSSSNGTAGNNEATKTSSSGSSTPATEPSIHEYDAEATYNLQHDQAQWDPFADLLKRRFLWYYSTYVATCKEGEKNHSPGDPFPRMEFEYPPNSMEGTYDYPDLLRRLERVKTALEAETDKWTSDGAKQVKQGSQLATQLAFQFKQLQHVWNSTSRSHSSRLELSLPDPANPFRWTLTLFCNPMTNLDGGIFTLSLSIPPTFPASAQPRVRVETPMFHHRVSSSTGTLCYFPKKQDEIASHLDAIVEAIDDVDPRYDPRAVLDPEAFSLFWGGAEKRKVYSRRLRQSAQESCEFAV